MGGTHSLKRAPSAPWVLVGANMVALHGWAKGREQIRPSRDADVLVNVRGVANATARLSRSLEQAGYELESVSAEGIGHRFVKNGIHIDVLGPDGVGPRANLRTVGGARTLQVPGGTQALQRAMNIEITTRSTVGTVPIPSLLGALLVKIRAIEVDDQPDAQRQDVAFLLTLVEDPEHLVQEMSTNERKWLRRHSYLADPSDACWQGVPNAEDGAIVFRRLALFPS